MLNQPLLHIPVDAAEYLHRKYDLEVVHLSSVSFVGTQPSRTFSTPFLNTENQLDASFFFIPTPLNGLYCTSATCGVEFHAQANSLKSAIF
jgi:hypothetical protein